MRCQVLASPKNGYFVNDKCDNVFNAACGIRCKPGYYLKGSSLRICQEGGSWSGRTTECISKYKGSRLRICQEGHCHFILKRRTFLYAILRIDASIIFTLKMCWVFLISYIFISVKTCPALPRPKNGNMICDKDGFSFSTVCRFTCDTGYKLVGSRKRECLAIAAWTGINTRCRGIYLTLPFPWPDETY